MELTHNVSGITMSEAELNDFVADHIQDLAEELDLAPFELTPLKGGLKATSKNINLEFTLAPNLLSIHSQFSRFWFFRKGRIDRALSKWVKNSFAVTEDM